MANYKIGGRVAGWAILDVPEAILDVSEAILDVPEAILDAG